MCIVGVNSVSTSPQWLFSFRRLYSRTAGADLDIGEGGGGHT